MQNFCGFVTALLPSFQQKRVAFLHIFFLHFAWTVGTQVGAVGAQHFPAEAGVQILPGWWVSWLLKSKRRSNSANCTLEAQA